MKLARIKTFYKYPTNLSSVIRNSTQLQKNTRCLSKTNCWENIQNQYGQSAAACMWCHRIHFNNFCTLNANYDNKYWNYGAVVCRALHWSHPGIRFSASANVSLGHIHIIACQAESSEITKIETQWNIIATSGGSGIHQHPNNRLSYLFVMRYTRMLTSNSTRWLNSTSCWVSLNNS